MSWKQRLIVVEQRTFDPPLNDRIVSCLVDAATGLPPMPGDCWYALKDDPHFAHRAAMLSPNYHRHNAGRLPIICCLPCCNGYHFWVDDMFWREGQPYGEGWVVTGAPPDLTLSPSINIVGLYHGYLQNGVLTDDCDGRQFPQFPPR